MVRDLSFTVHKNHNHSDKKNCRIQVNLDRKVHRASEVRKEILGDLGTKEARVIWGLKEEWAPKETQVSMVDVSFKAFQSDDLS